MDKELTKQFDGLLEKYTELLIGEVTDELTEKVKMWALYIHIAKSMPPLAKHWNVTYPDAKNEMKTIINEIKALNEKHREKTNPK
ncbi:YusU family protein [Metabacillus bambusae]|uniref:YusU family protein n=1 Tax=Metabacillus bambusae TaxID=2795218 RepID=A0ABS3MYB6_9BACI|nr:YusU family protein [Metabacillus bambusae]MBO1510905.1 YusU family protein [Metabacillus bambusae]